MGFSIIETDRLLICPYHLACAIPMAAEGGKRFLTTEHTESTERIFLCVPCASAVKIFRSRDRAGRDRTGADGNTFSLGLLR